jgi:hypothetical protein
MCRKSVLLGTAFAALAVVSLAASPTMANDSGVQLERNGGGYAIESLRPAQKSFIMNQGALPYQTELSLFRADFVGDGINIPEEWLGLGIVVMTDAKDVKDVAAMYYTRMLADMASLSLDDRSNLPASVSQSDRTDRAMQTANNVQPPAFMGSVYHQVKTEGNYPLVSQRGGLVDGSGFDATVGTA